MANPLASMDRSIEAVRVNSGRSCKVWTKPSYSCIAVVVRAAWAVDV